MRTGRPVRVLYSFPHRIGAGQDLRDRMAAGGRPGRRRSARSSSVPRQCTARSRTDVTVRPTLARGAPASLRVVGDMRAFALHDRASHAASGAPPRRRHRSHVAARVRARRCGPRGSWGSRPSSSDPIRTRDSPTTSSGRNGNASGSQFPADQEHANESDVLTKEEQEYDTRRPSRLPVRLRRSDIPRRGLPAGAARAPLLRLRRHRSSARRPSRPGEQTVHDAVRRCGCSSQGTALRLEAWHRSSASATASSGSQVRSCPSYGEQLEPMLAHPSVEALGHRTDVPRADARGGRPRPSEHRGGFGPRLGRGSGERLRPPRLRYVLRGRDPREERLRPPCRGRRRLGVQIDRLASDRDLLARTRARPSRAPPT